MSESFHLFEPITNFFGPLRSVYALKIICFYTFVS